MFFAGIVWRLIREKDFCSIYDRQIKPTKKFCLALAPKISKKRKTPPDGNQEGQAFSRCSGHAAKHQSNQEGSTKALRRSSRLHLLE